MATQTSSLPNVHTNERGASIVAGTLLIYAGIRKANWMGLAIAAAGAAFIKRGITGHCEIYQTLGVRTNSDGQTHAPVPYGQGIRVDKAVTVNKPRFEVYSFWRNFENLSSFMNHIDRVRQTSDTQSHWIAKAPMGHTVEWDAEIINDVPGELIGWKSIGGDVQNAGSVHFRDAAGNRGTEVKVELQYIPPGGSLGALVAKMMGSDPESQIEEDLRRFKMMLETGETTNVAHEQRKAEDSVKKQAKEADVHKASEESFPASDAPAWR